MSAPLGMGHDRSRKLEEEIDPVEEMIKKTGCLEHHYKIQDCMADKQDWRECQKEVNTFRKCMMDYQIKTQKERQDKPIDKQDKPIDKLKS